MFRATVRNFGQNVDDRQCSLVGKLAVYACRNRIFPKPIKSNYSKKSIKQSGLVHIFEVHIHDLTLKRQSRPTRRLVK